MTALPFRRPLLVVVLLALSLVIALVAWQAATPRAHPLTASEPEPKLEPESERALPTTTTAPPPSPSATSPTDANAERELAMEIRSLVAAGQIGKARARAHTYYERFPDGPSGAELGRLTGAHPRRDASGSRP
jgi:hypothetical protein